jgi:arabinosyltransferase
MSPALLQGREKIGLIDTFTGLNFSILVSDVDTVWMRNPLPFMAALPQADVLTSSDHLVHMGAGGSSH